MSDDEQTDWICNLEIERTDALRRAREANQDGNTFAHGYHAGRAQVLDAWIISAKVAAGRGITTDGND